MGKSGKLFKSLVAGVRVFKSPAKERPVKDHEKEYVKKSGKDKCFGSLGKSSSRSREVITAAVASPEAIEIKCVQVESEKLKDVLPVPVAEAFRQEPHVESKLPAKNQDGAVNGNGLIQLSPTAPKDQAVVSEREEWAASKIQAAFRCYLAQRAFRALRALVRLQALARGRLVRRQAAASLRCVDALIRVQALARGRRVRNSELGQLVQKHLQQTKQSRKKSADGWVNSMATAQQLHAKAQVKQDAVTKRQRALVYAYSEQLNRRTQKESSSSGVDSQIEKSLWVWEWLERWTAAAPKGASAAIVVEDCAPVTKNIEKAKANTKGGKPLESGRKERRKWGEQPDSISPLPQRDTIYEDHEEPSIMVKREEETKVLPESEIRVRTPKANVRKPISPPPMTLSTPPHTPLKEGNALAVREISLRDVQPSASDTSSDVIQSTSLTDVAEAKVASPSEFEAFPSAAWGNNHASGAEKTDDYITLPCPMASSQLSPSSSVFSTSNGHSVYAASEISPMESDSPPKESQLNSFSAFSFSPQEVCPSSSSLSTTHSSKELNTLGFSAVMCGSSSPESAQGGLLSGVVHQPEAIIQTTNGDINVHSAEEPEAVHSINGDKGVNTTEEMDYDATKVSNEQESIAMDEVEEKNDDSYQGDTLSETNGGCDASVVSVDARSIEVSSKNISNLGSKHELTECVSPNISNLGSKHELTECVSPSLPSYMATTKSSKAKIRALSSPKQKSDSTKQKQDSPKPKLDSPKVKVDSPTTTQKVDSASKRRHSLSALDGSKVSPVTQRPAFHVRASSKGNFLSMKDLSSDNFSLPNGESRRHGK